MKSFALTLSVVLSGSLASTAVAQCQSGGGTAPATSTPSIGTSFTTAIPLINSAEMTRRQVQQMYRRQMQAAYMQAAYMQQMRQAHEQQQAVAHEKEGKRQEKLDVWRERREAELARREAAKERNLARYNSRRSMAARK